MDTIFLEVLNMSFTASVVIVAVVLVRLALQKAPKVFTYALWAVVLFRLLCPVSLTSVLALLPTSQPISQDIIYQTVPQIDSGFTVVDNVVNPVLPAVTNHTTSINPIQIWIAVGMYLWIAGMIVMAVYSVICYGKLRKKLVGATCLRDNIYLVDFLDTPFVTGIFVPKIYLPSNLEETEQTYIIAHEQCHIRRFDHVTRLLGFVALSVHWFNPLVWVAFVLSGKDMELSCDEAVMNTVDGDLRADYAQSLLRLATGRKLLTATPLAFGEGETKGRVKNVLHYKKPTLWAVGLGVVAVIVAMVMLGSNPETEEETYSSVAGVGTELRLEETAYVELEIQEKTNYSIRCIITDVLTSQDFPLGAKLNFTCEEGFTMTTKDGGTFVYDWDEPNMSDSDLAVGDIIRVGYTVYDPYQEGNNYYNHLEANSIVYWGLDGIPQYHAEYEELVDAVAYEQYGAILAQEMENTLAAYASLGDFTGYEVTRFVYAWDYENAADNSTVQVYDLKFALLTDDPFSVTWAGGMYMDEQGRVQGVSNGDLAVKYVDNQLVAAVFLPSDIQWVPTNEEDREIAIEVVNNALVGSWYSDEETTITMTIEGDAEEISAIVTHKEGYSIAIPVDEWVEADDNHWQAIANEDVYFYIFYLDIEDIQEVAIWCLDTQGEVTDWMGRDSIFVSNAGNTHFLTALGSSEKGHYYGLGHCPNEAMEGFGTRMGYIMDTVTLWRWR